MPIFHLLPLVCGILCHPVAGLTLRASILIALRREFLNLPRGSFIALRLVVVFRRMKERRLKLESAIRAADAATKLHLEKAALRDIEAYRHLQRLHLSHAHEIRK